MQIKTHTHYTRIQAKAGEANKPITGEDVRQTFKPSWWQSKPLQASCETLWQYLPRSHLHVNTVCLRAPEDAAKNAHRVIRNRQNLEKLPNTQQPAEWI